MKKIINGRVYDTSTAKKCSEVVDVGGVEALDFYGLTLYQKRTGEFFFSRDVYRGSLPDALIPAEYAEARSWAEHNLGADAYQSIFGAVAEDDSRTALNLSLSTAAAETARRAAAAHGITVSAYIEQLIGKGE